MKTLLIVVLAVVAMAFGGWLTFGSSDEDVSITVNTAEVKEDTKKVVAAGEKLIDDLSEKADASVDAVKASVEKATEEPDTTRE
jgi:hypothetical protein